MDKHETESPSAPGSGTLRTPGPAAGDESRLIAEVEAAQARARLQPAAEFSTTRPARDLIAEMQKKHPRVFEKPPAPTPEEVARRRLDDEERARQVQAEGQRRLLRAFLETVGRRYVDATLESYSATTPEQRKVLSAVRNYAEDLVARLAAGDGVVLHGPPGTGKDHLLIGLARVAIDEGRAVEWVSGPDLYGMFRDSIGGSDESERGLIKRFATPPVLILSDAIPPVGAVTPYQATSLYRILDTRYRQCRPTWASLNVASAEEADARMGAAICDRLTHGALVLKCSWPSFRRPAPTQDVRDDRRGKLHRQQSGGTRRSPTAAPVRTSVSEEFGFVPTTT